MKCSVHVFNLVAFLGVLAAIVTLSLAGRATDLAIMTGLVGVLGSFKPWGVQAPPEGVQPVTVENDKDNPVPTKDAK